MGIISERFKRSWRLKRKPVSPKWISRQPRVTRMLIRNGPLIVRLGRQLYTEAERKGALADWRRELRPEVGRTIENPPRFVLREHEPLLQRIIELGSLANEFERVEDQHRIVIMHKVRGLFNEIASFQSPHWVYRYIQKFRNAESMTIENAHRILAARQALRELGYKGKDLTRIEYQLGIAGYLKASGEIDHRVPVEGFMKNHAFREDYPLFRKLYKKHLKALR